VDGHVLRLRQKLAGAQAVPARADARALFRCNLACAGCGKIQLSAQHPQDGPDSGECFRAVDEWRRPHGSDSGATADASADREIIEGLVARKKYIYLCTNALLLKEKIHLFQAPAST